ncbi:MAG: hypothetical protein WB919_19275, partial [Candidatus Sulfotelmatobacter sp.]
MAEKKQDNDKQAKQALTPVNSAIVNLCFLNADGSPMKPQPEKVDARASSLCGRTEECWQPLRRTDNYSLAIPADEMVLIEAQCNADDGTQACFLPAVVSVGCGGTKTADMVMKRNEEPSGSSYKVSLTLRA